MTIRFKAKQFPILRCVCQILALVFIICLTSQTLDKYLLGQHPDVIELTHDAQGENETSKSELNEDFETDDYFHFDLLSVPAYLPLGWHASLQKINSYLGDFIEINTPPPEYIT